MSRQPRVAVLTSQYDIVRTGPGTQTQYLRQAQAAGLLDLTFFSTDMAQPRHSHEVSVKPPLPLPFPVRMLAQEWVRYAAFRRAHKRQPFDVLWCSEHFHGYGTVFPVTNIPVIISLNDYFRAEARNMRATARAFGRKEALRHRLWHSFERRALNHANPVVCTSHYIANAAHMQHGVPRERLQVIYPAVDFSLFRASQRRAFLADGVLRVLFVKTFWRQFGLEDVVGTLAQIDAPVALTVVGPPPDQHDAIRAVARRSGYRGELRLTGRLGREAVAAAMHNHDVFCMPSRTEGVGTVLIEALASELPAIGGDVGGIPEALDEGRAGWLVPPYESAAITTAIRKIADNDALRAQKVSHGAHHAQQFAIANIMPRIQAMLAAVAAER